MIDMIENMAIGIVGSREFVDYPLMRQSILRHYPEPKRHVRVIVSGGAKGADTLGERFAMEFKIPTIIHYPDWNRYKERAGFIRNKSIVDDSDVIFAFWDGTSSGTLSTITLARKQMIPVHTIRFVRE